MKINEFNCHVIYGWYEPLNQWHITSIVPENFTMEQTANLKDINQLLTKGACGQSMSHYYPKGTEFPCFIQVDNKLTSNYQIGMRRFLR